MHLQIPGSGGSFSISFLIVVGPRLYSTRVYIVPPRSSEFPLRHRRMYTTRSSVTSVPTPPRPGRLVTVLSSPPTVDAFSDRPRKREGEDKTKFLTPDPHVTDPLGSQAYNRFSYTINNPVNLIDPTGFDYGDAGCIGLECLGGGGWDGTFGDPSELLQPGIQWITPTPDGSSRVRPQYQGADRRKHDSEV